jgi:hypothetical protein
MTMRVHWKSMLLGAVAGVAMLVAVAAMLFAVASGGSHEQRHRTFKLASGRALEIMGLYFAFGDEHSQRGAIDDSISVQYVSAAAKGEARDREAAEVFEAIRPLSESLGVATAEVCAYSSLSLKGRSEIYAYSRDTTGVWTFKRVDQTGSGN